MFERIDTPSGMRRVSSFIALCLKIQTSPEKEMELSVAELEKVVGTGKRAKELRAALTKTKGAARFADGTIENARYKINPPILQDLMNQAGKTVNTIMAMR